MQSNSMKQRKKSFNETINVLWVIIIICLILYGGKLLGYQWPLNPNVAFARLLQHPVVAGIELFFSCSLLFLVKFYQSKVRLIRYIATLSVVTAIYHMFVYLIGTEFILLWPSAELMKGKIKSA